MRAEYPGHLYLFPAPCCREPGRERCPACHNAPGCAGSGIERSPGMHRIRQGRARWFVSGRERYLACYHASVRNRWQRGRSAIRPPACHHTDQHLPKKGGLKSGNSGSWGHQSPSMPPCTTSRPARREPECRAVPRLTTIRQGQPVTMVSLLPV